MLYFVERQSDKLIKIGITKNFHNRIMDLRREYGELELIGWMEGYRELEMELHYQFRKFREDGEFFRPERELLDYIENNACPIHYQEWETELYATWMSGNGEFKRSKLERLHKRIEQLQSENRQLRFENYMQVSNQKPSRRKPIRDTKSNTLEFPHTNKSKNIRNEKPREIVKKEVRYIIREVEQFVYTNDYYEYREKALANAENDIRWIKQVLGLPPDESVSDSWRRHKPRQKQAG